MKIQQLYKAKQIEIIRSRKTDVDKYLRRYHYLQSTPAGAKYRFWAIVNDPNYHMGIFPRKVGAAMWGRPVARLEDQENTLELTRFYVSDICGPNSESRFLALMLKYLQKQGYYRFIAYSDPEQNHWGTIYRATGWKLVNETTSKSWSNRNGRTAGLQGPKFKYELITDIRHNTQKGVKK